MWPAVLWALMAVGLRDQVASDRQDRALCWSAEGPGQRTVGRGLCPERPSGQSSGHPMGFLFQALSSPEAQLHFPGLRSSNVLFLYKKNSHFSNPVAA